MINTKLFSDAELQRWLTKNQEETKIITKELQRRVAKGGSVVMYECEECGKKDKDFYVIKQHLMDDHRYPDEDAGLCSTEIYD